MGLNPSSLHHKIRATLPLFFVYLTGIILRLALMKSNYQSAIADSFEVSTPANSWKRVTEALHFLQNNIDPYSGDRFHETPLVLFFYQLLLKLLPEYIVFVAVDVSTACVLYHVAKKEAEDVHEEREVNKDKAGGDDAIRKFWCGREFADAAFYVVLVYLFNPFCVASCVGMSTVVLNNFVVALFLYSLVKGSFLAPLWFSLASVFSLYPIVLFMPMVLKFAKFKTAVALTTITIISLLHYCNYVISKDWKFLESTYGFLLTAPDLQPNLGIFWYFFAEVFEHFKIVFLCFFQINATILYTTALSLKFRNYPLFLSVALLSIYTIFKSYPCVGDVGFVLSLLPLCSNLLPYTNCSFIVTVMFLLSSLLAPIFSYLWLNGGLGNANFYFGASLAFNGAQIFLIVDLLFTHSKREFITNNHGKIKNFDVVLAG